MPFVQRIVNPTFLSRSSYGKGKAGFVLQQQTHKLQKGSGTNVCNYCRATATTTTSSSRNTSYDDRIIINQNAQTGCTCTTSDTNGRSEDSYDNSCNNQIINGREFETISNITLSNCLRQLASVVIIANDIFLDLNSELQRVSCRTQSIKQKIVALEENVNKYNPKVVEVPESDFETFLQIKDHFKTNLVSEKNLFIKETRPRHVQNLYEAAGRIPAYDSVDLVDATTRNNITENCTFFSNGDSFEQKKLKIDAEIEIRLPAAIRKLRKWTSVEALGEVTVTPDCINKVGSFLESDQLKIPTTYQNPSTYTKFNDIGSENDTPIDHRLPSPEEQCQMIANKYPAEVISVDISGRRFDRMCLARKSMYADSRSGHNDNNSKDDNERKSRSKKSRGKRRNTIIGIDPKEISEAVQGDPSQSSNDLPLTKSISERSKSSDLLRNRDLNEPGKSTLSRLNSLKNWGRNRLKLADRSSDDNNKKNKHSNFQEADSEIDEFKINTITNNNSSSNKNRKRFFEKGKNYFSNSNEPKNSEKIVVNYFKSESTSNSPESIATTTSSPSPHHIVKLRESSSLRRQRRNDSSNFNKDEPHSSSGNWSASSESGRASIGSEITILPKSSASSISLNHNNSYQSFGTGPPSSVVSRRRFLNTSASSSVTSEGPSTPDPQMMNDISFIDDETSSAYSCDTEGYYTSFHIDSGLKTLREEEPVTPLHSTSALSSNNSIGTLLNQTGESEYELFGRGSTSTTASSAGTVCTTLLTGNENDLSSMSFSEAVDNKLSYSSSNCSSSTAVSTLERGGTIKRNSKILHRELVEVTVHLEKNLEKQKEDAENAAIQADINYDNECAEYSDVESQDRSERIRQKTAISSSRIPSMCIITPTTSDDENTKVTGIPTNIGNHEVQYATVLSKESKGKLYNRNIIELPYGQEHSSISNENLYDLANEFLEPVKLVKAEDDSDVDIDISFDKDVYHSIGEYVTLADVSNNNDNQLSNNLLSSTQPQSPVYGNLKNVPQESEYVSLKELPQHLNNKSIHHKAFPFGTIVEEPEKINNNVARKNDSRKTKQELECKNSPTDSEMRVSFNAQGKIIYNSDSLRRQKRGHTTFLPGPHVKDAGSALSSLSSTTFKNNYYASKSIENKSFGKLSGGCVNRELKNIRPIARDKILRQQHQNLNLQGEKKLKKDIIELTAAKKEMQETKEFQTLLQSKNEPFNRNAQIYGTLPRKDLTRNTQKKFTKNIYETSNLPTSTTSLNAVSSSSMSPIVPCNKGNFTTSTPSKLAQSNDQDINFTPPRPTDLQNQKSTKPNNTTSNSNEIPKICSDRLGTAKTSLMDFKKLLLAKSTTKHIATNSKLSAVELLKASKQNVNLNNTKTAGNKTTTSTKQPPQTSSLNSSMLLLELSRSPRTFANRRMIRQGQFGSPSKYIVGGGAKKRNYALGSSIGTDVMSTTIPEANKEEDSTSSSGSLGSQRSNISADDNNIKHKSDSIEHIDLKKNFFLQSEENNFMKSEIDASKYRPQLSQLRQDMSKAIKNEINTKQNVSEASKPPSFETSL